MARDVVERLRQYGAFADRSFAGEPWINPSDARLLLAVVEAAKEYRHVQENAFASKPDSPRQAAQRLDAALARLYAGSSGES